MWNILQKHVASKPQKKPWVQQQHHWLNYDTKGEVKRFSTIMVSIRQATAMHHSFGSRFLQLYDWHADYSGLRQFQI